MTKFKLTAVSGTEEFTTEWELPQVVTKKEWSFLEKNLQAATDKCELLTAIKNSESNIINYMNAEKIHTLETENALLRADIGRREQTTAIVAAVQSQCGPACCPPTTSVK